MATSRKGLTVNGIKPKPRPKVTSNGVTRASSLANKVPLLRPPDWLRGSMKKGGKYTAWDTFGQGKPDFGKGKGPGDPYHETQSVVGSKKANRPPIVSNRTYQPVKEKDAKLSAIQRRLRGL